ncbi:MAG: polyhydroxyalkanoic acid system family protein [Sinobacteraceae bacterium]|nr:polyhydroxyalkanoic acid system family protein [Nevskiaceae bacterium]
MPRIDIRRRHALPPDQARAAVEQVAAKVRDKYGVEARWQGNTLAFERPGVKGSIAVGADEVRVVVELGLLLGALKGPIEQEIRRQLDARFGA